LSNNNCNNEFKEYYKTDDEIIYLVCADDFYIKNIMLMMIDQHLKIMWVILSKVLMIL